MNDGIGRGDSNEMAYGRRFVLSTLDAMTGSTISNISRTRSTIKKVWRMRDLQVGDAKIGFRESDRSESQAGDTSSNDWEHFVAPVSTHISLA